MDLGHAKELDGILIKAKTKYWVGETEGRERDLAKYISVEFGYTEKGGMGESYKISGAGRIAMEIYDNALIVAKFLYDEQAKKAMEYEKKALKREKTRDYIIKSAVPLISAVIGSLLTYFLGKR